MLPSGHVSFSNLFILKNKTTGLALTYVFEKKHDV